MPPIFFQSHVHLEPNEECRADDLVAAKNNLIPPKTGENTYEAEMRPFDVYRLLENKASPLKLGKPGRQNMSQHVTVTKE